MNIIYKYNSHIKIISIAVFIITLTIIIFTTISWHNPNLANPQKPVSIANKQPLPEPMQIEFPPIEYDPIYRPNRVPPPDRSKLSTKSVTFIVNNGATSCGGAAMPQQYLTAFNYALSIWTTVLEGIQPIVIDVCWNDIPGRAIGRGGAMLMVGVYGNLNPNIYYSTAYINQVVSDDIFPTLADINIEVDNSPGDAWYLGTDGNTPQGQVDFVTVVLHEVGHGLGFTGSVKSTDGSTATSGFLGLPFIYDTLTEDGNGRKITSYASPSTELYNALRGQVGGIFFNGYSAGVANNNSKVKLYTPDPVVSGASYSHLDITFNSSLNSLMTHSLNNGESVHNPGIVTLGIFKDMGWNINTTNLNINKSASSLNVHRGKALTYTIDIQNTGLITLSNIIITDTVPANTTLIASSLSGDSKNNGITPGSHITWTTNTNLTPGQSLSRVLVITVSTEITDRDIINNMAYISSTTLTIVKHSNTVATIVGDTVKTYLPMIFK